MAEVKRPKSRGRRRPRKNSSCRETLKLCTAYLYRKDGCMREELCNNLHICRNYMLEQCRKGNSCAFSHDLQSGQTSIMLMRNFGFCPSGETRRKFKSLFAATIRSPKDRATDESEESKVKNKRLNEEKLMDFLESFSEVKAKSTTVASHSLAQVPAATPRHPSENAKSRNSTPSTDPQLSERPQVMERPSGEKTTKVTQEKKPTQNTVEGSQALGEASSPTSSSADQELPSSSRERLEVCCHYLRGNCSSHEMKHRNFLHCLQPFQWQIQDTRTKKKSWLDLSKQANSHLEKHFCDVNNKEYTGGILVCGAKTNTVLMHVVTISFGKHSFAIQDGFNQVLDVRRLSTLSFARAGGWRKEYSTQWVWYWKDGTKKWREYPQQVPVKAGNPASSSINTLILERKYLDFKLKEKSSSYVFTTDEGQFQLNFSRMEQTCLADQRVCEVARRPKYSTLERPVNSTQSDPDEKESCDSNFSADKHSDELNQVAAPKKVNKDNASVEDVKETKSPKEEKQPRVEKKEEKVAEIGASQSVKPRVVDYKAMPLDVKESCDSNFSADKHSDELNPVAAPKKVNKDNASVEDLKETKSPKDVKQPRKEKKEEKVAEIGASQSVKPRVVGYKAMAPNFASPLHLPKEPEASVFMVKKPDVAPPKEVTGRALLSRDTDKFSENIFRGPHPSRVQDAVGPKEMSKDQQLQEAKPKWRALDCDHLNATLDRIIDRGALAPQKASEVQEILKTLVDNLKKDGTWTHLPYSLMMKIITAQNLYLEQSPDTPDPKLKEEHVSVLPLKEASAKNVSQKSKLPSPRSPANPFVAAPSSPTDDACQRTGYQTESVYICTYFLRGKCIFKEDKYNHKRHYRQPFQWQIKDPRGQTGWQDLSHTENHSVEKIYCDVNRSLYSSQSDRYLHSDVMTIRFGVSPMTGSTGFTSHVHVQRLSSVSSVTKSNWEKAFCIEWVWYWLDETQKWIVYSGQNMKGIAAGIDSSSIEQKYLDYESKQGAAKIYFTAGNQQYELDFNAMEQRNIRYQTRRQVRRRPKFVTMEERKQESKRYVARAQGGSVEVPGTWDNPGAQTDEVLVSMRHFTTAEYINIANLFWDTMDNTATIISIQRVQNLELWEDFTKMRERMKKRKKGQPVLQKQLFHGTQKKYTDAISRQNFDWRLSGTTVGTLYGKGSYFARDASFSNSYTAPDSVDCRYVFVAQVLIGDTTTGVSSYVRPPPKDQNEPHGELYDSCVDNMSDPQIFVVFEKTQVYPEYLIRYKLRSSVFPSNAASAQSMRRQTPAYTTRTTTRTAASSTYQTHSASSNPAQNYTSPNPSFQTSSANRNTSTNPSTSSAGYSPPPRPSSPKKQSSCTIQ